MPEALPDVEGALRTWMRTLSSITTLVGQRVFFGVPKGAGESTFPLVTVSRVGGGDAEGEAPVDQALVQVECWGSFDASGNGRKAQATALVNAVRSEFRAVNGSTVLSGTTIALGINVESVVWLPDPDSDRPRYVVTAEVTAMVT